LIDDLWKTGAIYPYIYTICINVKWLVSQEAGMPFRQIVKRCTIELIEYPTTNRIP
jgi:hypothetical protein